VQDAPQPTQEPWCARSDQKRSAARPRADPRRARSASLNLCSSATRRRSKSAPTSTPIGHPNRDDVELHQRADQPVQKNFPWKKRRRRGAARHQSSRRRHHQRPAIRADRCSAIQEDSGVTRSAPAKAKASNSRSRLMKSLTSSAPSRRTDRPRRSSRSCAGAFGLAAVHSKPQTSTTQERQDAQAGQRPHPREYRFQLRQHSRHHDR